MDLVFIITKLLAVKYLPLGQLELSLTENGCLEPRYSSIYSMDKIDSGFQKRKKKKTGLDPRDLKKCYKYGIFGSDFLIDLQLSCISRKG